MKHEGAILALVHLEVVYVAVCDLVGRLALRGHAQSHVLLGVLHLTKLVFLCLRVCGAVGRLLTLVR